MFFKILLLLLTYIAYTTAADYCAHEYFTPECGDDEVIVMEKATYGRMKAGRCLEKKISDEMINNPLFFGCKVDVLDILDSKCSGLKKCNVQVIDPELTKKSLCYSGLMQYLSAEYSCLSVIKADTTCSVVLASSSIYLSAGTTRKHVPACGSVGNPWFVETSEGQTINVSMISFTSTNLIESNNSNLRSNYKCDHSQLLSKSDYLVKITEPRDKFTHNVCMPSKRQGHVLQSKSNKIELEVSDNPGNRIILKLEAIGCYDLKPPQDAWMKREGNKITVGCFMNRHTWKLICNGRSWIGVIGNCTQQSQMDTFEMNAAVQKSEMVSDNPKMVFLTTVAGCSILLLCLIALCSLMMLYQRTRRQKSSFLQFKTNTTYSCNDAKTTKVIPRENGFPENMQAQHANEKDHSYYVLDGDEESKKYFVLEPKADS